MEHLRWTAIATSIPGVIITIIAVVTWPRSEYGSVDPTWNIAWLSLGSALVTIAIFAFLLYLHAGAVREGFQDAIAADRAAVARAQKAAEARRID